MWGMVCGPVVALGAESSARCQGLSTAGPRKGEGLSCTSAAAAGVFRLRELPPVPEHPLAGGPEKAGGQQPGGGGWLGQEPGTAACCATFSAPAMHVSRLPCVLPASPARLPASLLTHRPSHASTRGLQTQRALPSSPPVCLPVGLPADCGHLYISLPLVCSAPSVPTLSTQASMTPATVRKGVQAWGG